MIHWYRFSTWSTSIHHPSSCNWELFWTFTNSCSVLLRRFVACGVANAGCFKILMLDISRDPGTKSVRDLSESLGRFARGLLMLLISSSTVGGVPKSSISESRYSRSAWSDITLSRSSSASSALCWLVIPIAFAFLLPFDNVLVSTTGLLDLLTAVIGMDIAPPPGPMATLVLSCSMTCEGAEVFVWQLTSVFTKRYRV